MAGGEREREAPKSMLEEELIEASANIGGSLHLQINPKKLGKIALH